MILGGEISANQASEYQIGPDAVTVFSKVSMQIIKKYKAGGDSRFKNFGKEDAYSMLIEDNYLLSEVAKNVYILYLIISINMIYILKCSIIININYRTKTN